jgi:uncharacterized delta-60 repeat protein
MQSNLRSAYLFGILFPFIACSSADKAAADPDPTEDPMDEPAPAPRFLLSLSTDKLPVLQGDRAELTVKVERRDGFEGAVELEVDGLPEGVAWAKVTIAADEAEAVLELNAPSSAPHSLPTAVKVTGRAAQLSDSRDLTVTVYGRPGDVDTSFQGGKVMTQVGEADAYAYAMAKQSDGKLIVVGTCHDHGGDFAVMRLTRDGELDATFGEGGLVTTQVGAGSDVARAVVVDDKGRIVVAGSAVDPAAGLDFAVVRYLANGDVDESFGAAGKARVSFSDDADTAYAVALQPDGKLLIGGDANLGTSASGMDFAIARLLDDGSLDESFGGDGRVTQAISTFSGRDSIYALTLQDVDGEPRIVAAGGERDFTLARFTTEGELDTTFGEEGKLAGLFGSTIGAARAVRTTDSGELLVAGQAQHDFALAKLSAAGSLVPSFGQEGKVTTAVSAENWDEAYGLGLEKDGNIVLAGFSYEGNSSAGNTALVRYTPDGELDDGFGDGGIVVTAVAASNKADQGSALLIATDERVPMQRIYVAGYASSSFSQFAVTRFWR